MIRRPLDRFGTGIGHFREIAQPPKHPDLEIVIHLNLAGESHVVSAILDSVKSGEFRFGHRSRVAPEDLDAAGRAPGITAATMQDVDAGTLDRQN